jgi:carboxypeptidase C (cathepsin A)
MTTTLNPWSWNNEANLLVIDQPNQVGYSYDVLTNVTVNIASNDEAGAIKPTNFDKHIPPTNNTFLVGTAGSQLVNSTANSTLHAAVALWHFAQTFFEEFPAYKPNDERISLFTESYGGHYGPGSTCICPRHNFS